jgi:hypothetical protein
MRNSITEGTVYMAKYKTGLSRTETEKLIDEWIFSERDRKLLKRRILDDITFEQLAEEFYLSVQQTKSIIYKGCDILTKHQ